LLTFGFKIKKLYTFSFIFFSKVVESFHQQKNWTFLKLPPQLIELYKQVCSHDNLVFKCPYHTMGGVWGSSTNKTDLHDITEVILKVALNTINQPTISTKIPVNQTLQMVISFKTNKQQKAQSIAF
jgi:hypothetical protein